MTEASIEHYLRRNGFPSDFHQDGDLRAAVAALLNHIDRSGQQQDADGVELLEVAIIRRLGALHSALSMNTDVRDR